ncbi:23S rRNA accumulation protein YceD [Rheinheimera sp. MMS21-TC3]|uniref:23S rRNA accumulation protein YceD n=1 Tax=Rheinheimera sp. MMS21-TC3 TaxID=3072790 RepID=UPI0028C48F7C|nr:23S rRNA accumulation protein YceD [Rheinheimera sp. MMS21-TC3]WNO61167.1 23S rRNA accumulation protein YceD [Rheinheimera sp. MMS21-TC3]
MQKVKMPVTLNLVKAAQKRSEYEGYYASETLTRLNESLLTSQEHVAVRIECGTDQQGLTVLQGSASCEVSVSCERCGQPMAVSLDCNFAYTPIKSDDEADLENIPECYDVIEKDDHGEINLRQLVEDELILTLPLFPTHDEALCAIKSADMSFGDLGQEAEKPNPFAILQELKKK